MFGRVRVASSSPDDLERPISKLLKHDSLSIYESTLLKLKVGSQNASSFPSEEEALHPENDSMTTEDGGDPVATKFPPLQQDPMAVDDAGSDLATTTTCAIASNYPEASTSTQTRQLSVTYLFSRFKSSRDDSSSPDKRIMNIESNCSSVSISPTSTNFQCIANVDQEICIS